MHRLGIIDLGSNSARLVVFDYRPGRWYRLVDEIQEPVRLGEGLQRSGLLGEGAIERALAVLGLFADYARATSLESVEVIATSAVREAGNREGFLRRIRRLGFRLSVLSGQDEARLAVLAVANGFSQNDAWVIDLGGGSLQVAAMRDRETRDCQSLRLGGVYLAEKFVSSDPPAAGEVAALEKHIAAELAEISRRLRDEPHEIVAMGGTVRNLAESILRGQQYPLELLHGYYLGLTPLESLTERLLEMRASRRAKLPGIHTHRADVIFAGALVLRHLLRSSGRKGLWISGQGIREGAFYQHFLPAPHLVPDVRRFGVDNLFERYPQARRHTRRVGKLATKIFDGLADLHRLGAPERELLEAAAQLHDIGKAINYYNHDRHGAYLVTSGPLLGFSHAEQATIAQLVLSHRKRSPKSGPYEAILGKAHTRSLPVLGTCLRLAEKLERSRAGRVRDLSVEVGRKSVRLRLLVDESPHVELWETQKQAGLFERTFGRRLKLESVTGGEGLTVGSRSRSG